MKSYLIRRLLLIPITLLAIITLNFFIIQFAPGGPVERAIAQLQGGISDGLGGLSGQSSDMVQLNTGSGIYRGADGIDPEDILRIEKMYGFDQPLTTRYFTLLTNYLRFDLGESYFKNARVSELILS